MITINKNLTIRQRLILGFSAICIILITAVFSTLIQTSSIERITEEIVDVRMPSTNTSGQMVNQINASLASIRGWLLTADVKFKDDRLVIWKEIYRIRAKMDILSTHWQGTESKKKWSQAKHLLNEFEKIQEKIEAIGHTVDEKPATKILIQQAAPQIEKMIKYISYMIDLERFYVPDSVKKTSILTALRGAMGYGGLIHNFKNYVLRGTAETKVAFEESVKRARTLLTDYKNYPMNVNELSAINKISQVISSYVENLELIEARDINSISSAEMTDKMVKVNDNPAVAALAFLDNANASATSGKQQLASKIRALLGYNGFIHHYKNYILRKDNNRFLKANEMLYEALNMIELYRLHSLIPREQSSLQDLERVIASYRNALIEARKQFEEGADAVQIDNSVRIDDEPALQALEFIDRTISNVIEQPEEAARQKSSTIQDRIRLLGVLADFRGSLAFSAAELRAYLLTGKEKYRKSFLKQWQVNTDKYKLFEHLQYLMTQEQYKAYIKLVDSRKIFAALPEKMFSIRSSKQWNMTNYLLVTQVVPLAEDLLVLLAGERNATGRREGGLASIELQLLIKNADANAKEISRLIQLQWFLLFSGLLVAIIIAIRTASSITIPLGWIKEAMSSIASGTSNVQIKGTEQHGEIGDLARTAQVFQKAAFRIEESNWKKTHIAEVSSKAQEVDSLTEFCRTAIDSLTPIVNGVVAAFYIYNPAKELLEMQSSYGYTARKHHDSQFQIREGIIGQAAYEQQKIILSPVPDDYIVVSSALGQSVPEMLIVLPVSHRSKLLGVIEIASFEPISQLHEELLDEMLPSLALSLENLIQMLHSRTLLEETKRQAVELRASEEEIRASEEELRASEEELRVSNDELMENTRSLENKTKALEQSEANQKEINTTLIDQNLVMQAQQKELEQILNENIGKTKEIEQASRYKSEFLANMSHELRTPLNSLLILAKSLAENEDDDLNEDNVEAAQIIHESGTLLLGRINEILDLSKVEAGKMPINLSLVNLEDIAQGIKRTFDHVANEKGLDFSVNVSGNMPEVITTDPDRLIQIIDNLIANAMKFTEQGKVELIIQSPKSVPENLGLTIKDPVEFAIMDTGIGISKEQVMHIFDAFRQADGSMSRKYGGTGLGLSISRKMAALLGGGIAVESQEGHGATFSLYIPSDTIFSYDGQGDVHDTSYKPDAIDEKKSGLINTEKVPWLKTNKDETELLSSIEDNINENSSEEPEADNRTLDELESFIDDDRAQISNEEQIILIVEDDPVFAKILVKRTQKNGLKAVATNKPEDGLLLAELLPFSGIILDVELPGMDGIELYKKLQLIAKTKKIPVHFISASDAQQRAQKVGNAGYFSKPVTAEQIDEALATFSVNKQDGGQNILIVDSDINSRITVRNQLDKKVNTKIYEAGTGMGAIETLQKQSIDCMILDLDLPDMDGIQLLEQLDNNADIILPKTVIYSARELSDEEVLLLRQYTDSLIFKEGQSSTRLQDEVILFLHSVKQNPKKLLSETEQTLGGSDLLMPGQEADLEGKTVLVVDDDIRNSFALSRALSGKGMKVLMAKDGIQSIKMLAENESVDIILMDVMMPGIDGYETTSRIRSDPKYKKIPILSITAKAMKGDRERCFEVGANDYLCKPVDMDKLLSMMRVWL